MNKIKVDKKTILTVASAVLGAGSFLVNILMSKDETEEDCAGSVPVFGDPDGRKRDGQRAGHHGKRGDRKKKEHRLYGASA